MNCLGNGGARVKYVYDDEDNAPMNDENMPGIKMTWKRYSDIIKDMQQEDPLPFTDPPLPEKGCWNCNEYNGDACMKNWNNLDESYYNPDTDDKEPSDYCDDWSLNPDVSADEFS